MSDFNEDSSADTTDTSNDTLERLRNITKMFSGRDDEHQQLQKVEKCTPSDKIKNTFQKFEDIGSSNGHFDDDEEIDDGIEDETVRSNGIIRSTRIKKTPKKHIPYHEMAEVKDKFEKGLVDVNKPRAEKRLDVRVQSGMTSSKKQAFEQGEFAQEVEPHVNKIQIETDLVAGLTSSKKQAFEQQQTENETSMTNKTVIVERDALTGVATEKKARFESGQFSDRPRVSGRPDELAIVVGTGLAHAKRSEILSRIDAEQQIQRSTDRCIDIDAEQGLATARRDQLASLANSEFKSTEKYTDVTTGLTTAIKEQYIADAGKAATSKTSMPTEDIESGLTRNRATAFENPDETTIKRSVDINNELRERGVAKERVAMFTNLENGSQSSTPGLSGDTKIRVDGFRWHVTTCQPINGSMLKRKHQRIRVDFSDTLITMSVRLKIKSTSMDTPIIPITSDEENGNVVRETDKCEEIYFEKGQTKQLVEQWKTKQISPERDTPDGSILPGTEMVQQGKAKNLVQMWKSIDKENTPPPERRGLRAFTPPTDNERRIPSAPDDEGINSSKLNYTDDKANIESGYAKTVRERFLQNAEQNNTLSKRKTLKQITPPPESPNINRRKSITPPNDGISLIEQYTNNEEIVPMKGQTNSLKNRFIELEQDALKVETASSKIKHVPKRFVNTPAPKQLNAEPINDSTKCSACNKTVYAMEKIEADKKVYHKSCFKCMHCKSILKLGNYTGNDGQIYCKPHFLQLFAVKGNYSTGFGLDDHKTRWMPSNPQESTSFNEN